MSEIYKAREELPTPAPSMTQMIIDRAAHTPTREAFRAPGDGGWTSYTWKEFVDDCSDLAAGLISLGLEQEERVGLASTTNVDWIRAAFAVALAGGAVTTVYSSTGAEDAAYILNDSESKILFAEDAEQLDKAKSHRDDIPGLEKVVMFDGDGDGDFVITLDDLRKLGKEKLEADPDAVRKRADAVEPEHLATLIYTSGTTGRPKGVELLHKSWGLAGAAVEASGDVTIDEVHFL